MNKLEELKEYIERNSSNIDDIVSATIMGYLKELEPRIELAEIIAYNEDYKTMINEYYVFKLSNEIIFGR